MLGCLTWCRLRHTVRRVITRAVSPSGNISLLANAASKSSMRLLVVGEKDAPELTVLEALPSRPLGVGRTLAALRSSGVTDEQLLSVDVLLAAGWGAESSAALEEIVCALPALRLVHTATAGVGHLLVPSVMRRDIILTNSKSVFSVALAEWAIAAMLFFSKNMLRLAEQKARREWTKFDVQPLRRKTLAIVGYGSIGQTTARLASAFGMRILALTRSARSTHDPLVHQWYLTSQLDSMLAEADYVVMSTPQTPETTKLMGAKQFEAMPAHAVFINIGRGACVDETALIAALTERRIAGAALDVFETEPLPEASPLWVFPNVLISPHCADFLPKCQHESLRLFLTNAQRFEAGEELLNVVDKHIGY